MPSSTTLLPQTTDALALLGALVTQGRIHRGWSEAELAERVGVTSKTLRKVEKGDPGVAIGTAFEAASLVGVPLFAPEEDLARARRREEERLALLPQRVRSKGSDEVVDDDF